MAGHSTTPTMVESILHCRDDPSHLRGVLLPARKPPLVLSRSGTTNQLSVTSNADESQGSCSTHDACTWREGPSLGISGSGRDETTRPVAPGFRVSRRQAVACLLVENGETMTANDIHITYACLCIYTYLSCLSLMYE